ncbi:MAG: RluA family pseudouridine synthase [Pseudomonadota bacterium]
MADGVRHLQVSPDYAGQRLDNYLQRLLGRVPKGAVYRLIRRGEVRVNGGRKAAHYRLKAGDDLRIPPFRPSPRAEPDRAPTGGRATRSLLDDLEQRVLFEDDDLLIIDKPSGLAVHGGSGVQIGAIEALKQLRSGPFLELVHRIDRDTSGCLAIAKSRATLIALQQQFREHRVGKRYRLLVDGCWMKGRLRINTPLRRTLTPSGERRVRVDRRAGKPSQTDVECIRAGTELSELQASPRTGRTHQIRVHAASQGCPVAGDSKYGSDAQQARWRYHGINRLCLHAERLRLHHGGQRLVVAATVPHEFALWFDRANSR